MQISPVNQFQQDPIVVVDADLEKYCTRGIEIGASHARQILPGSVVTAPWVLMKCRFGCPGYGRGHCCPPRTPGPDETRRILDSYNRAILFHIEVPHMANKEEHYKGYFDGLVELEGEVFKDGYYKAFLFLAGPCRLCKKCGALEGKLCAMPWKARPSMEACGIDVYRTARDNGFFIQPLRERNETNNEYCLLMVD